MDNVELTNQSDDSYHPIVDTSPHMENYESTGFTNADDDELYLPGYQTMYTIDKKVEITLLKICTEMEAPLYAFEAIMKWAHDAYHEGYKFSP